MQTVELFFQFALLVRDLFLEPLYFLVDFVDKSLFLLLAFGNLQVVFRKQEKIESEFVLFHFFLLLAFFLLFPLFVDDVLDELLFGNQDLRLVATQLLILFIVFTLLLISLSAVLVVFHFLFHRLLLFLLVLA